MIKDFTTFLVNGYCCPTSFTNILCYGHFSYECQWLFSHIAFVPCFLFPRLYQFGERLLLAGFPLHIGFQPAFVEFSRKIALRTDSCEWEDEDFHTSSLPSSVIPSLFALCLPCLLLVECLLDFFKKNIKDNNTSQLCYKHSDIPTTGFWFYLSKNL